MRFLKKLRRIIFLKGEPDLGRGPVLATLTKIALPSIAMVLFHTSFNLVDTIFISWLGESSMVAVSYTFPVQIGVFAILEGVGNGITALVGRKLGEDNLEEARRTAVAGISFAYLLCLLWIPFLFPYTSNLFFSALGASDPETLHQAWLYNVWIPPMLVLISFSFVTNSVFRCQGNTIVPLYFFLIANGLNFILDPIFMFVFNWGITGAAAATMTGRLVGTVYLVRKLRTDSKIHVPLIPSFSWQMLPLWKNITAIGLPVTLSTGSVALGMGSVNKILGAAYGPHAVAAWMIALRVEDLAFNTLMGINDALVPFLAFNYGKRDLSRIKKGISSSFIIAAAITGLSGLLVCLFPQPIIALFRPTKEVADIAVYAIRVSICAYPMVIYSVMYNSLFIATGRSEYGMATQLVRSVILRVPAAYFLSMYVSLNYIWWFQPIAFVGATVVTMIFSWVLMRKIKKEILV